VHFIPARNPAALKGAGRGAASSSTGSAAAMQSAELRFSENRNDLTSMASDRASAALTPGALSMSRTPAAKRSCVAAAWGAAPPACAASPTLTLAAARDADVGTAAAFAAGWGAR
jgi:hypothetical protein